MLKLVIIKIHDQDTVFVPKTYAKTFALFIVLTQGFTLG